MCFLLNPSPSLLDVLADPCVRLQTVFNATNEFFFNGIDCQPNNPDWCVLAFLLRARMWLSLATAPAIAAPMPFLFFACWPFQRRCCAVGEAEKPSSVPGARIHCTQDGGKTWNQTFFQPGVNGGGNVTVRGKHGNPLWYARLPGSACHGGVFTCLRAPCLSSERLPCTHAPVCGVHRR